MKNIFKIIAGLAIVSMIVISCKKDDKQVLFNGGTEPVLTSSLASGSVLPLSFANSRNVVLTLNWTNPEYEFSTGVSSQDVTYTVEIDTVGANFTNPKRQQITVANELSVSITDSAMNDYLLNQLELRVGTPHQIEIRVSAAIGAAEATRLHSNTLNYTVTPYAIPPKVAPPASGTLFLVGSASPGGWNNPVPVPSQQFTRISETLYELTVDIVPGGSYLFLPVNGSWSAKYGTVGGNNTNAVGGGDFKAEGGDMLAPSTSGSHKIVVDFQRGKWTITKL